MKLVRVIRSSLSVPEGFLSARRLYIEGTGCDYSVSPVAEENKGCLFKKKNSRADLKINMNKDHLLIGTEPSTGIQKQISHEILGAHLFIQSVVHVCYIGLHRTHSPFFWK